MAQALAATTRSRGLAFVLSLLVVGLGHAYLGQWRRAALWVCAPLAGTLLFCACTILLTLRGAFGALTPVALSGAERMRPVQTARSMALP